MHLNDCVAGLELAFLLGILRSSVRVADTKISLFPPCLNDGAGQPILDLALPKQRATSTINTRWEFASGRETLESGLKYSSLA